ncbi:MAG: hypothetical protein H7833_01400 [Magnetococcus sp. DMHC-1]|nr:hypothetical protein [Magnetococcales bacterium]
MKDLDAIREMMSRGLDADLDRTEIRRLFLMVARDETVRKEMEEMAVLEEALAGMARESAQPVALPDISGRVRAALQAPATRPLSIFPAWLEPLRSFAGTAFSRLKEMNRWQLSIGTGLAVAALAMFVIVPLWSRPSQGDGPRLVVHDLQFIDAQPRVAWTNQFIVPPGGDTHLVLKLADEKLIRIQFQSVESTTVRVIHDTPGSMRGSTSEFTVDGIGYATLRRPRTGDGVVVQNQGAVPLVVYLQVTGSDGTIFSHTPKDRRHAL